MSPNLLLKTARFILDSEARRNSRGELAVYRLPAGDGGGTFEVAGINDRYDHDKAYELRRLIEAGQPQAAERIALAYYIENTDAVAAWSNIPAIEAFLRDACFNRGAGGAAKILQTALGVGVDGKIGPRSKAALRKAEADPRALLFELRAACERYERRIAPPVGARAKFWKGLVNRWQHRLDFCLTLL